MLDAGVRAMRVGQGRACISARESITCSLTLSLMDWWRRVGVPCFSFTEQCGAARGGGSRDARGGQHLTGEGPPASFMPKNPPGFSACLRRGRCCRPSRRAPPAPGSRRAHSTGRDRLLADDQLGRPQQQPHRYQWCTECGNSLLVPCTLLRPVAS